MKIWPLSGAADLAFRSAQLPGLRVNFRTSGSLPPGNFQTSGPPSGPQGHCRRATSGPQGQLPDLRVNFRTSRSTSGPQGQLPDLTVNYNNYRRAVASSPKDSNRGAVSAHSHNRPPHRIPSSSSHWFSTPLQQVSSCRFPRSSAAFFFITVISEIVHQHRAELSPALTDHQGRSDCLQLAPACCSSRSRPAP